eukprot:2630804-Rhodomonas_salina.8
MPRSYSHVIGSSVFRCRGSDTMRLMRAAEWVQGGRVHERTGELSFARTRWTIPMSVSKSMSRALTEQICDVKMSMSRDPTARMRDVTVHVSSSDRAAAASRTHSRT